MKQVLHSDSYEQTIDLGAQIGSSLKGGEVFELISDLGGGKTAFVRGLAKGFGSNDPVASPTFTLSFVYERADGKRLHHFDFYRLNDAGIMKHEIDEVAGDEQAVVAVEWGEVVRDVLPADTITIHIQRAGEEQRQFTFDYSESQAYLFEKVRQ